MIVTPQLKQQLEHPRRRKYLAFESQIFAQKFGPGEFASNDLVISPRDFIHYTVIRQVPESPANVMVVVHGYGGFGGVFYRLVEQLARHFFVVLVDLPDMGFSSRQSGPIFNDTDSAIEYFVSRLQAFVDQMGFKRFSLMGHSIGAFLATHLFGRVPDRVDQLFLLSPAGFNPVGDPHFTEKKKQFLENSNFLKRYLVGAIEKRLYEEKQSPFEMFWVPMSAKKWLMRKYWNSPRFKMTPEESRLFYKVQAYFLSLPQSGEKCLGYLLHYGVNSTRPIIDVLLKFKDQASKVHVFFGDHDWMDGEASRQRIAGHELEVPVFFVNNSEHQLIFQNPEEIAERILEASQTRPANK